MLTASRKAFTLLELIVVIVILGILAALAIPTFQAVINKSKESTAIAAAESVGRDAYALAAFAETQDVTVNAELTDDPDTAADESTWSFLDQAASETSGKVTVDSGDNVDSIVLDVDGILISLGYEGSAVEGDVLVDGTGDGPI